MGTVVDKYSEIRRRSGRPAGMQHDRTIHVRLPGVAVTAIRRLAARSRVNVSQVIRSAVESKLAALTRACIDIAKNPEKSAGSKLAAIRTIDDCALVGLHLSPAGLKLARAKAMTMAGETE